MKNTTVRWQISYCGFDIPIFHLYPHRTPIVVGIISPCCGLCLRRVSLNLENLRPTHEQNTSFGNLDQHFFTIMSSKMVMFQKQKNYKSVRTPATSPPWHETGSQHMLGSSNWLVIQHGNEKSPKNWHLNRRFIDKWRMSHGHVWLPEGNRFVIRGFIGKS